MNQLAYFPLPYQGELFYSLIARYHRHVGSPKMMYSQEALFGKRFIISAYDLPGHLDAFVDHVPDRNLLSANNIIDSLTLFNYFAAFAPQELRQQIREAMHIGAKDIHVRLGISAFRIGRLSQLQFCPRCTEEMMDQHGELYWRRDHQLAGVLVCPLHGCQLLKSNVVLTVHSRHEFVAASALNCPSDAPPVATTWNDEAAIPLLQLAQRCAELLSHPPNALTPSAWTDFYHEKMIAAGFAKSPTTMDQRHFLDEFHQYCDGLLGCAPYSATISRSCEAWVAKLVRKHKNASHPLYHLLLQSFLDEHGKNSPPFGRGPWPCLNPLATHINSNPIKTVQTHRNHEKLVGVFQCECGYVYTRNVRPGTLTLGSPRLLRYGPMLAPALRDGIAKGLSLRALGRSLGLDPKTVICLAQKLDISTPWKATVLKKIAQARPSSKPKIKPDHSLIHRFASENEKPIRPSWTAIDSAYATLLLKVVDTVLLLKPPVRISIAELERRTNRRGWIYANRICLPKTISVLQNVIEDTDSFQTRRIKCEIERQMQLNGEVRAWRVMRKAGISSKDLEKIKTILLTTEEKHMASKN